MKEDIKLQLKGIIKSFPGVRALKGVSVDIHKGTVHSIVGENGAGKSTLMKIISGAERADEGEIWLDGQPVTIRDPRHASELGIAMIYQELSFMPDLRIEENLVINRHPVKRGIPLVDWKKVRQQAVEAMQQEEMHHSPDTLLSDLSISDIQLLEIIKATSEDAQIIIMDEPTSSLTQHETERLFEKIKRMRSEGRTVIYISHKMEEIFELSDYVTIMRDGEFVSTRPIADVTHDEIITMMVGRKIENIYPERESEIGDVVFETQNLSFGKVYQDVSFNVRKGEIVGFAGLVGAGRTEIMRGIVGLDPVTAGEVVMNGKTINHSNVEKTVDNGIMMATEDRRRYGLIPIRNIKENITLASLKKMCIGPFIKKRQEKQVAQQYFDRMRVKADSIETLTYTLSGGNQQKVVLAKWMTAQPKVFILDEPTRGIDVGAKFEIYNIMNEMAAEGMALIMISSELPELLGMCDRIYVVCEGRIAGELQKSEFTQERVINYATGGK